MAARRIVIKVGSSTLASESGGVDREYVGALVDQVRELAGGGAQVVIVTSGAIAAGVERLGLAQRPSDMPGLQAAASVGQVALLEVYSDSLSEAGLIAGQVLLTRHDTGHRESFLHARDTFERLLDLGAVPVVNENDTVAVDEIRFGDNDTLAALVATMVHADLVVLLSDIEGLYDADPRVSTEAKLLSQVDVLTDDLVAAAGGAGTDVGSGGMATKIDAAKMLMKAGIPMVICDGRRAGVVVDAVAGKQVGTVFDGGEGSIGARKLWIALGSKPAGEIVIDDGARQAIRTKNTSLLPAGVVAVSGRFAAGDPIAVCDVSGAVVARGLSEMSSEDLDRVKGLKSGQAVEVLPHLAGKPVVHRDHMVVL
ncbi:MAG: glutamate 5-kinase [Coriobacteriia bacterium]|nr:glutamate 5-kinase [Coriobacteriia bacterium]